jgi:uncharacterized Zn-binding protein involved in type VI secretion
MHTCPMVTGIVPHVGGPILPPGCPTVLIGMMPAARVGDMATCVGPPDVIALGSFTVMIGGMNAARMGDMTAHGGVIVTGFPTVMIGGPAVVASGPAGAALSLALARALVAPGGSGDAADAELVAQELAKFPPSILMAMMRANTRFVACRGSVTDYRTALRGVQPRGWPTGSTWDSVPGAYMPDTNEVVIATTGHGTPGGAHVPATGEGHGSANLVLHEGAHGLDHGDGTTAPRSSSAAFTTARTNDAATLSPYESQAGAAGQEESYAESAARHFSGDPNDAANHPNLNSYWASNPVP